MVAESADSPHFIEELPLSELPQAATILQSSLWARVKAEFSWRPHAFKLEGEGLLLLQRRFPAGFSLAYVPHGLSSWEDLKEESRGLRLLELSRALSARLARKTLFIRYDLPWEMSPERAGEYLETVGFRKAPYDIQPPSTVLLSLGEGEDALLKGMKSKTRYNIRLAEKKGVRTRIYRAEEALGASAPDAPDPNTGQDPLRRWYELYRETARRDAIAIHSQQYYRRLFSIAAEAAADNRREAAVDASFRSSPPELSLLFAEHEGDLLAGIVLSLYQGRAVYLYGAGSNRKRNLMASYAVQWQAIRFAAEKGAESYDLFGIPPADDPSHPMHGLYRFKTGFGGRIVHRPGCWDFPLNSGGYGLYRWLERLRYTYYKKLRKR